jgi:hypothetical protein
MHKAIKRFIVGFIAVGLPLGLAATTMGAASAATTHAAGAASAARPDVTPPGPSTITSVANKNCLDPFDGRVVTFSCNNTSYQVWNIPGDGTIVNTGAGCLTGDDNDAVRTALCNGSPYQLWEINGDGTIGNPETGLFLTVDRHGKVFLAPDSGGSITQIWNVAPASGG